MGDAAIATGGDIGSSIVSGLFGQHSANKAMKFEERMSNTAYQRAALDLEKAGLNRVLALGSPATTPGGSQASMPDAKAGSAWQAGASAKSARDVNNKSMEVMEANKQNIFADTEKKNADTEVSRVQKANVVADTALKIGNTQQLQWLRNKLDADIAEINARIPTYGWSAKQMQAQTRKLGYEADILNPKAAAFKKGQKWIDDFLDSVPDPKKSHGSLIDSNPSNYNKDRRPLPKGLKLMR